MLLISAIAPAFAALPITFEENRGQAPPEVAFVSRAAGYRVFLTKTGTVITSAHSGERFFDFFSKLLGDCR